jgi:L-amino acid N-acyltransferase YncA
LPREGFQSIGIARRGPMKTTMPVANEASRFEVREATPDDAEAIVRILNPIIDAGVYTVLDGPIAAEQERSFIRGCSPQGVFHVAVDTADRTVVGFQNAQPIAAYTHAFDHVCDMGTYVDLARRRQGIASALFRASFAALADRRCEKIFTFVRADNPVSLKTYQHHGFTVVGVASRHARVRGSYVDETIIEKHLRTS